MPLLGKYDISPFIHANLAFAPNRNIGQDEPLSAKTFIQNYARASLGFGL